MRDGAWSALITAVKRLAKTGQVVEVLVVSLNDDRPLLFRCLRTGAFRHVRRSEMQPQPKHSSQTVYRRPHSLRPSVPLNGVTLGAAWAWC
jgi:hypothetical protein